MVLSTKTPVCMYSCMHIAYVCMHVGMRDYFAADIQAWLHCSASDALNAVATKQRAMEAFGNWMSSSCLRLKAFKTQLEYGWGIGAEKINRQTIVCWLPLPCLLDIFPQIWGRFWSGTYPLWTPTSLMPCGSFLAHLHPMLLYVLELTTAIPFSLVLLKVVSPIQLVLKADSPLSQVLSHFCIYIWWTTSAISPCSIQFKILTQILQSQRGIAPKYLVDVILRPLSASSNRPLDLLVPRSRTALAQSRSFASIGPSLWNALYPSIRSTFLPVSHSVFRPPLSLETILLSWGLAHRQRFWTVHPTRSAIQMFKYNTVRCRIYSCSCGCV